MTDKYTREVLAEFDEKFSDGRYKNRIMKRNLVGGYTQTATTKDIKDFITQTIQKERTRIVKELEGNRKGFGGGGFGVGFNQALDTAIGVVEDGE